MLNELLGGNLFALLLVFARIGSTFVLLPGFGEAFVPARVRLVIAAATTVVVTPTVAPALVSLPATLAGLAVLVIGEAVIGLFIGMLARMVMTAMHIAGTIIGFQASLGNAALFDPASAQQGTLVAAFLHLLGVFLIFASSLDHLMILAVADSYQLFQPGRGLPLADFSDASLRVMAASFAIGMQIAAPLIVIGLLFQVGLGLLSRLMPQIQLFFVAVPAQILLSFVVMALTLSAGGLLFLGSFQDTFSGLMGLR
ncbi:MAG: flagellar biosynthetic protein FliR [Rhodospirillales bacterium]